MAYQCSNTNLENIILKGKAVKTSCEIVIELLYVWPWVLQEGDGPPRDTTEGTHVSFEGRGRVLPIGHLPHTLTGNVKTHTSMGGRKPPAESAAEISVSCGLNLHVCQQKAPAYRWPAVMRVALVGQERQLGVGGNAQTRNTGDPILSAKYEANHL